MQIILWAHLKISNQNNLLPHQSKISRERSRVTLRIIENDVEQIHTRDARHSMVIAIPALSGGRGSHERPPSVIDFDFCPGPGVDPGVAALTGNIAVRYADNTLMNTARSGVPIDLQLAYKIDADRQLIIECHEVYLPKPKRSISGPSGIEASYDFQGAKDAVLGHMVTVTLVNDVEAY